MIEEMLPIKFFSKREEDKQRVEGITPKEMPRWVLSDTELKTRSQYLSAGIDKVINEIEWPNRTVPVIIQATLIKDAHAKSHRRKIESVLLAKPNTIIGVGAEDTIIFKVDSLDDACEIKKRLKDTEKNAYGISGIEEITRFHTPVEYADGQVNYKIKLFDFHDFSANQSYQTKFEQLLRLKEVKYNRTDYAQSLVIYKLRDMSTAELDILLQADLFDLAEEIVPMPSLEIAVDALDSMRTVSIKYPNENKKSTTVGVLDNGIALVKQLKPWIDGKRISKYPDSSVEAVKAGL